MRISFLLSSVIVLSMALPGPAQTPSPKYERGAIMAVMRHQAGPEERDDVIKYDISVQVRNTMYVVLYAPPNGANFVEYSAGMDLLVSVADDTLTFPSKLTGTTHVPILRKEALPPQPTLDWSKAPSRYFEMKMQNLTENLDLSRDQRSKINPIVQQEAGESVQFLFTTSIPRKERLNRWRKIVRSSDAKMKSVVTQAQWKKLQEICKREAKDLEAFLAAQPNASNN